MQYNTKKLKDDVQAVSPVVATLMLVLVAAGSAVGIGVWVSSVQDDATDGLNTDVSGNCLKVGGSTTVHPVNQQMKALYEQATGLCVEISQGGSGAGMRGVGIGTLDIGARSAPVTAGDLAAYPDYNLDGVADPGYEVVSTVIGYDAVNWFVDPSNCLAGQAEADLLDYEIIQDLYAGALGITGYVSKTGIRVDGLATWANVADELAEGTSVATTAATTATTICDANTNVVVLTDREDLGGTSELACEKLIGTKAGPDTASAKLICSEDSNKQIPNVAPLLFADGNAAVEALIKGNPDALGYSSFGTGKASGLTPLDFEGKTPSIETIKAGSFAGSRPLVYVTIDEPQGTAAHFIDFVRDLQRNDAVLNNIGYVSIQDTLA